MRYGGHAAKGCGGRSSSRSSIWEGGLGLSTASPSRNMVLPWSSARILQNHRQAFFIFTEPSMSAYQRTGYSIRRWRFREKGNQPRAAMNSSPLTFVNSHRNRRASRPWRPKRESAPRSSTAESGVVGGFPWAESPSARCRRPGAWWTPSAVRFLWGRPALT